MAAAMHWQLHCLILELDRQVTQHYWIAINDPGYPFLAVVEHTNYISPAHYEGKHLMYVGNYLPMTHPLYKKSGDATVRGVPAVPEAHQPGPAGLVGYASAFLRRSIRSAGSHDALQGIHRTPCDTCAQPVHGQHVPDLSPGSRPELQRDHGGAYGALARQRQERGLASPSSTTALPLAPPSEPARSDDVEYLSRTIGHAQQLKIVLRDVLLREQRAADPVEQALPV